MSHTSESTAAADRAWGKQEIMCRTSGVELCAVLEEAGDALGTVVLVHGSGVTCRDGRNGFIASRLVDAGLCVVRLDLLAESEAHDRHNVFDADLQARRLLDVTAWLRSRPDMRGLPLGYLGSGIGASVVLETAGRAPERVSAVVVQGRADAARFWLPRVVAPTLVIADAHPRGETVVGEATYESLGGERKLVRVSTPGHCFAEREAMSQVAHYAQRWFLQHFAVDMARTRARQAAADASAHPGAT